MPSGGDNSQLPGMGGAYNPFNLGLYTYSHFNPVRYSDPDGNSPYNNLNGIQAHNLFSSWVEQKGSQWVANSALSTIYKEMGLPTTRPDALNKNTKEVFELKPVTHKNQPDKRLKDQAQVGGYLASLAAAGDPHEAGEPTGLVPDVPGGTNIGNILGADLSTYSVTIYPGKDKGMIYYSLTEEKSGGEKVGNLAKQLGKSLANSGPGSWYKVGPMPRPETGVGD